MVDERIRLGGRWNKNYREKHKYLERNPSQCHFVHHKVYIESPTIETGPPDATDRRLINSSTARLIQGIEIMRGHAGSSEIVRTAVVIFDTKNDDRHTHTPCMKGCLWVKSYRPEARGRREHVTLRFPLAVCPQPLPKPVLPT